MVHQRKKRRVVIGAAEENCEMRKAVAGKKEGSENVVDGAGWTK